MAAKSINEEKCYQVNIKEKLHDRYVAFAIKKDKTHNSVIDDIKKSILEK